MSASFVRLVVACGFLAALAVFVPKIAPNLVAGAASSSTADNVTPPPAKVRPLTSDEVAIPANAQGDFLTDATVDGQAFRVVVDTGANTVALTSGTARSLGFHLAQSDFSGRISTANGIAAAAPVMLPEVRVGDIRVRDVAAVVVAGDGLDVNLLGMTFLSRLKRFEIAGGRLVLSE
ncbi:MAG TPA: TIGR02281 family clan AA aspartic protease [Bauldia sp.]|jgi:aspartyl protease family protein